MVDDEFIDAHRNSSTDFTRKSMLDFKNLFLFISNIRTSSSQNEMDSFFQKLFSEEISTSPVTDTAFFHARKKLNPNAFTELDRECCDLFYESEHVKKWNCFRLFGIDGSTLTLPEDPKLADFFGREKDDNPNSPIKARISQIYDVLNDLSYHTTITPYRESERSAALKHLVHAKEGDLVLYDRGYPSLQLITYHTSKKVQFCFRSKISGWNIIKEFVESGKSEAIVELSPDKRNIKWFEQYNLKQNTVKVRLLRIDIGGDEPEILLTSLTDKTTYPHSEFKKLYHLRWGVETSYRRLKETCSGQNFSAKSVKGIKQDFFGKIFTFNLTSILSKGVEERINKRNSHHKWRYKINWSNALSKFKQFGILLFTRRNFTKLLADFTSLLMLKPCPVRSNRSYIRKKSKRKSQSRATYKSL